MDLRAKDPTAVVECIQQRDYDGARAAIEAFQLQPGLLDAVLPSAVSLLASIDRQSLQVLYTLTKVRGYKVVSQLLPSDPSLLNRLLDSLETETNWQARYALLLWLSIVILAPFDLALWGPTTSKRVQDISFGALTKSGKERDAAALVMARFLMRSRDLDAFFAWAADATGFKQLGVLQTLAFLAPNVDLEKHLDSKWFEGGNSLTDKLRIKILGRAALRPLASPEFVESVVVQVLYGLNDSAVAVRMSAGKYIARLATHLSSTQEYDPAPDIFGEIMSVFDGQPRIDTSWQGALIAMAEMVRRGYDFVPQLDQIGDILEEALHFSQLALRKTYGSNVRDAACYLCWAMFKRSFPRKLYSSLIGLACFDGEVNIRRAAAAALQEGIGRQEGGANEDDLRLIQLLNFQSVTSISRSYLEIAPQVGADPKYLVKHGLENEDADIRRLAAVAVPIVRASFTDTYKQWLKSNRQDRRHAAMLALAALGDAQLEYLEPIPDHFPDLYCEGVLAQASVLVQRGTSVVDLVLKCTSDAPAVVEALKKFASQLPPDANDYIVAWSENLDKFVPALCSYPHPSALRDEALVRATTLPDARTRSLAIAAIKPDVDIISAALDDYQTDKRGDVGAWVRQAAAERVREVPERPLILKLWRLAGERTDAIRAAATATLTELGYLKGTVLDAAAADLSIREPVLYGVVSTAGATKVSPTLLNSTLESLLRHSWTLGAIMRLDRRKCPVVICLERLVGRGAEPGSDKQLLLAIAMNTTIQTRDINLLTSAIQLLGWLAPTEPKAALRLAKLCRHSSGGIRKFASEALFEAGYEDDLLETTDWAGPNHVDAANKLVERITSLI